MKDKKSAKHLLPSLNPDTPRRVAVELMLVLCLDQAKICAREWREHPDDERLHEFRIALRRCRMLLRVFNTDVNEHGGGKLREALTKVAGRLGAVRDLDVIILLVQKSRFSRSGRNEDDVARLLELTERLREKGLKSVQRMGVGSAWKNTLTQSREFIRRLETDRPDAVDCTIKDFLDREYGRYVRRITRLAYAAESQDGVVLHNVRVRLRRFRYLGDLLTGLADKSQRKTFKQIHACEKQLGLVHDIDIALAFFEQHVDRTPVLFKRELEEQRQARLKRFRKKWAKYRRKPGV